MICNGKCNKLHLFFNNNIKILMIKLSCEILLNLTHNHINSIFKYLNFLKNYFCYIITSCFL